MGNIPHSPQKRCYNICSAFFNFRIPKNIPKIFLKCHFLSKKMQVESGGNIEDVAKYSLIFLYTLLWSCRGKS